LALANADIFAPVLSIIDAADETELLAALDICPYALTVAVFGEEAHARQIAKQITAGTVLINDLIVPTADPRVPFGGRRQSGFGVTRGTEGLLEMTAVKVVSVRRGSSVKHYEPTTDTRASLFDGLIRARHGESWTERGRGIRQMVAAIRRLRIK
jgi:delta 1-pyrroline-5-carboxylate dehydrogenase